MRRLVLAAIAVLALAGSAAAQTKVCDSVPAKQRPLVKELLGALHPYDCCDGTIAACLAAKKRCRLAVRLADDVCRQVKMGRSRADIERVLDLRAQSMVATGKLATVAVDEAMRAGDHQAPVVVVEYACTRCPYCKMLTGPLHREVTEGALRGKVKLYFRPFPLKDHAGSVEGGLALMAAAKQGKLWPYLLRLYERFDRFTPEALAGWAGELGMDQAAFTRVMEDPAVRAALTASKREGLRNKVTATPTLFINGRKYVGADLDMPVLVDVLTEEYERVTKTDRDSSVQVR